MPKPNDDKRLTREQLGYVRHHSAEWASDVAREALTLMDERDEARREKLVLRSACSAKDREMDTLRRENEALRELHKAADDLRTQVIEYDKVDEEQELLVAVVTNAEFHALCDALDKLDAARSVPAPDVRFEVRLVQRNDIEELQNMRTVTAMAYDTVDRMHRESDTFTFEQLNNIRHDLQAAMLSFDAALYDAAQQRELQARERRK